MNVFKIEVYFSPIDLIVMENQLSSLPFRTMNYKLLGLAFGIVILGMFLMSVDSPRDITAFNASAFDHLHISVAPVVILVGYLLGIYAILKK